MEERDAQRLTREELLHRAGAGGLFLGAGALLAACSGSGGSGGATGTGSGATQAGATTSGAANVKKGGVLHVGLGGGSTDDTIDAHIFHSRADAIRLLCLYDGLTEINNNAALEKRLAEEIEPNATSDVWTIRVRDGVEFHNGKTLSADDVIFTLKRILDPATKALTRDKLAPILKPSGIEKVDDRTIRLRLLTRFAILPLWIGDTVSANVVPVGYDPRKPVGTGAWKYESFKPGEGSVFTRFANYWDQPAYADQLVLTDISDDSARVNALLSGQVDVVNQVPFAQGKVVQQGGFGMVNSPTGAWAPLCMGVKTKPFDDVRVRQAFRLIADRQQMIDQGLAGYGTLGHDLYGRWDHCYASDIAKRMQDIEQAKSLLKQAGASDLTVQLAAAPVTPGIIEASQVFAENAKAAGVTVKVNKMDTGTLWGDNLFKWPFCVSTWASYSYLVNASSADGPGASWAETQFSDPEFNKLFRQALVEIDDDKRCEIEHAMQQIQYDRGGYLVWGFTNSIDAHSNSVAGILPDKTGFTLGRGQLNKVHFV